MDYANGKIYTIRSKETELYYIGSTTQPLSKRFGYHITKFKQLGDAYNNTAREILKYADAYIELYEAFPCANKDELNRREGQLQREFREKIVNFKMEGRTAEEKKEYNAKYRTEHKEDIKESVKKYAKANAEVIKEKQHQKYERNKEANKEQKSAKGKEYYAANKERINEKNNKRRREQALAKKAEALV